MKEKTFTIELSYRGETKIISVVVRPNTYGATLSYAGASFGVNTPEKLKEVFDSERECFEAHVDKRLAYLDTMTGALSALGFVESKTELEQDND